MSNVVLQVKPFLASTLKVFGLNLIFSQGQLTCKTQNKYRWSVVYDYKFNINTRPYFALCAKNISGYGFKMYTRACIHVYIHTHTHTHVRHSVHPKFSQGDLECGISHTDTQELKNAKYAIKSIIIFCKQDANVMQIHYLELIN